MYFSFYFPIVGCQAWSPSLIPIESVLRLSAHRYQFVNCTLTHQAASSVRALGEGSREEEILIPEGRGKT